ncbi:MAG: bifunctional phosphoribosylaminoimidazolecarboxamide formyltransferase/IMP cyclohydrolase [Wolbachia endosymbiont of Xenopsylla cheopis]
MIKRALISVYNKTNIVDLAFFLLEQEVEIISTGNTHKTLLEAGINTQEVSDYTGFPEILDGRVKTLHPKVHGGILNNRKQHNAEIDRLNIESIDLLIINLYPFLQASSDVNLSEEQVIEQIDIGGVALMRAAAKNFHFVTIISEIGDYSILKEQMRANYGSTTLEYRKQLAAKAFAITSSYDSYIYNWLENKSDDLPKFFISHGQKVQDLRCGENPHQKAAFYSDKFTQYPLEKCYGSKDLSYNNIVDIEAAIKIVAEFAEPAAAIIKHTNPCGVALGNDIFNAYKKALLCDEVSSFGGVVALNREIESELAEEINKMFIEVVIAPSISREALAVLQKKKNLRIIISKSYKQNKYNIKNVTGGFLVQESNLHQLTIKEMKQVTKRSATEMEKNELLFAWKVCKHVKSNAIVIAKNQSAIGIGAGQMSRIDSVKIAIEKAGNCQGAILASDAFFPFSDSIIQSANAGITAIIQPGGSVKDKEVIEEADKNNIAMLFTGIRSFCH